MSSVCLTRMHTHTHTPNIHTRPCFAWQDSEHSLCNTAAHTRTYLDLGSTREGSWKEARDHLTPYDNLAECWNIRDH